MHSATPSLSASSRSPPASRSPRMPSIQPRTSFAACGVYLSNRILRRSLSSDDTDAMVSQKICDMCREMCCPLSNQPESVYLLCPTCASLRLQWFSATRNRLRAVTRFRNDSRTCEKVSQVNNIDKETIAPGASLININRRREQGHQQTACAECDVCRPAPHCPLARCG